VESTLAPVVLINGSSFSNTSVFLLFLLFLQDFSQPDSTCEEKGVEQSRALLQVKRSSWIPIYLFEEKRRLVNIEKKIIEYCLLFSYFEILVKKNLEIEPELSLTIIDKSVARFQGFFFIVNDNYKTDFSHLRP